jgi:hypothetical protein
MPPQLVALADGPDILLDKPLLLLGRQQDCDVRLRSRKVSRRHCCIARGNRCLFVRDLGSTNGIRINGVRVTEGCLNPRDELAIGKYRYRVLWEGRPARAKRRSPRVGVPAALPASYRAEGGGLDESGEVPVALPEPEVAPRRSRRHRRKHPAPTEMAPPASPPDAGTVAAAGSETCPGVAATQLESAAEGPAADADGSATAAAPVEEDRAEKAPPAPAVKPAKERPPDRQAAGEDEEPAEPPRWLLGAGLGALFLGPAALLCASAAPLCGLVVPLAAAGVVFGAAAAWRMRARYRASARLPAAGAALSGAVLLVALLLPGLLGPAYQSSRQQDPRDPDALHALPLAGRGEERAVGESEWPDASQVVLRRGGLRVQVLAVSVGRVKIPGAAKKTYTAEKYLLVRLRFQQAEGGQDFAGRNGTPPGARDEDNRARLTDDAGKEYPQREVLDVGGVQQARRSHLFPVSVVEEVFVFEPPPPGVASLRLEVPAAGWGASGTFRFTIPRSLVRRTAGG